MPAPWRPCRQPRHAPAAEPPPPNPIPRTFVPNRIPEPTMSATENNKPESSPANPAAAAAAQGNGAPPNGARKKALTGVAAAVVVAGVAYGAYWALVLNHFESTDNAYAHANVAQLTPQGGGTVVAINTDDT